ncbi:ATP-binding protein [Blautia producta]|uniref:ATP-binding protein n=1 Tax=Blautia producta TaxID=33035 RepID=UPI00210EE590|nr:ATP-binding protein [Blautia producta]MCQ4743835.1 MarR family transcriptional regulator [Blautia producta]
MGDKSQKLSFDDRLRLMYSKGSRYYEDEPVADSSIDDIDMDFVASYCHKIGYTKSPEEYIRQNKSFIVTKGGRQEMSGAAILLFGKDPQQYFQRARIRFIRYEGTEAKLGTEMNVVKDKVFTGRILDMVEKALAFVRDQIKEHTYLGKEGKFVTTPEYPEFVWKEIIINATAHRDYSIKGTDIQVKMFDDRIVVESPGNLPGIVRLSNMRQVHFSRNPKIAAFLHEYDYVQEFGEGVDRMYREMEKAGLPEPEYRDVAFMLHATIRNGINVADNVVENVADNVVNVAVIKKLSTTEQAILEHIRVSPELSAKELAALLHKTPRTIQRNMNSLKEKGILRREGSDRSGKWIVLK